MNRLEITFPMGIYCECDLSASEKRAPNGLYKKARSGEIANFTGISAPYEVPIKPDVVINTNALSVNEEVTHILKNLTEIKLIDLKKTLMITITL